MSQNKNPRQKKTLLPDVGNVDSLNISYIVEDWEENEFGIPNTDGCKFQYRMDLKPCLYQDRFNIVFQEGSLHNTILHNFTDDWRFEPVWKKPLQAIEYLLKHKAPVWMGCDFSTFNNYPIAIQIYNLYRCRFICRFSELNGMPVIIPAQWSDNNLFNELSFCSLPRGKSLAVHNVGWDKVTWEKEFSKLLEYTIPYNVFIYGDGKLSEHFYSRTNIIQVPSFSRTFFSSVLKKGSLIFALFVYFLYICI